MLSLPALQILCLLILWSVAVKRRSWNTLL